MSQWQRKQAGAIAGAATAYMDSIQQEDTRAGLVRIVRLAKAMENTDDAGTHMLSNLQAELCGFCSSEKIFPCRGYQQQNGCAFVETGLALTPSHFATLT